MEIIGSAVGEELFYIQDARSYCGNSCYWWRVDGKGYTTDLNEAWKVSKEKAERIIRSRPDVDKAWPCAEVDARSTTQTFLDQQKLYDVKPLKGK